jgi:hypothetical protein
MKVSFAEFKDATANIKEIDDALKKLNNTKKAASFSMDDVKGVVDDYPELYLMKNNKD